MKSLQWYVAPTILCVTSASVSGKGPTTRIVLTAQDLASLVEIIDTTI
jgi:hypothetical protein